MLDIGENDKLKKNVNKGIFTVSGNIFKDNKNIVLISKKSSKLLEEEIINHAIELHLHGNILKAAKYYQYCINKGLADHRVFNNFGLILKDQGKLKEAEFYTSKAIEIKHDFVEALSNLGAIFIDLGKLEKAELSISKAINLNPDNYIAHSNQALVFFYLGKLNEAEIYIKKAIKLNPNYANAYLSFGLILKELGKSKQAFESYKKAIEINPDLPSIYNHITDLLYDSEIHKFNKSNLKYMFGLLLLRDDVEHIKLFQAFHYLYGHHIINKLGGKYSQISITKVFYNKVIFEAFRKIIFLDFHLEKILTILRKDLCLFIDQNIGNFRDFQLRAVIALAEQCFLNEYIYSLTNQENISINRIINRCRYKELNEISISILACYLPLYKLIDKIPSLKSFNSSDKSFNQLLKLQLLDPLYEIYLSKNIKSLGSISDRVSQKVKSQYEENPYPRWRYSDPSKYKKYNINQVINNEINPNYISNNISNDKLKILVAGCGTGSHILSTQKYNNSEITAIDLSLSSLSYAIRKLNEIGITNVKIIQMDLLEVDLLHQKFDIIEAIGVLHHMDNPIRGLKALLSVLKNNGFLKLGLYSELARQEVFNAREYIANKNLKPCEKNIRDFRQKVISGELNDLNPLKNFSDFYSLSECRDLCFHSQEHRFKLEQLDEILIANELNFHGFLLPKKIKSLYNNYFPEDKKQTNLQNWVRFEEMHPVTFKSMYQFWVSK